MVNITSIKVTGIFVGKSFDNVAFSDVVLIKFNSDEGTKEMTENEFYRMLNEEIYTRNKEIARINSIIEKTKKDINRIKNVTH